jgi:hypothetical protein
MTATGPVPEILHCFADYGVESEPLSTYGRVVRIGLDPRDTNDSEPVAADAEQLPLGDVQFRLGFFQPPCTRWADMPDANKNGDAPNYIPAAREIAAEFCDHYVIENKPRAPLDDPVYLNGKQFGLPIEYERAFETSFPCDQPPREHQLVTESSSYFYSEMSREWWASVKGVREQPYTKHALSKNSCPAPYVHHLCRAWLRATDQHDGPSNYDNYDKRKDAERALASNRTLEAYR